MPRNTSDRETEAVASPTEPAAPVAEPATSSKQFLVAEEVPDISNKETAPSVAHEEDTGRIFPKSSFDNHDKSSRWLLWATIILVTLATAVVGAVVVMHKSTSQPVKEVLIEKPFPTPTTEPSPAPAVSRSDVKVQVLNGSGIAGKAATAKTYLESLGYVNVKIGNASSTDYEITEISIKKSKARYTDLIVKDVSGEYTLAEEIGILEEDDTYDIVIILGTE